MHVRENLYNALRKENTRIKRIEIIIDQVPSITNIHLNNLKVTEYYRIENKVIFTYCQISTHIIFDVLEFTLWFDATNCIFVICNMSLYYKYRHRPYEMVHLFLRMLILKPWHFKSYIQILQKDMIFGFSLSVYMLNRQIYIRNEFEVFKWKTQVVQIWGLR